MVVAAIKKVVTVNSVELYGVSGYLDRDILILLRDHRGRRIQDIAPYIESPFKLYLYSIIETVGVSLSDMRLRELEKEWKKEISWFPEAQLQSSKSMLPHTQIRYRNEIIRLYNDKKVLIPMGRCENLIKDQKQTQFNDKGEKNYITGVGHYTDAEDCLIINTII